MNFKLFLENPDIRFASFSKDGTIVVYINGKKYEYLTDSLYHDKWKKMIMFNSWLF